jgi:O-acetyl-ADP-ribose deacetylase (regulator of RNase III)
MGPGGVVARIRLEEGDITEAGVDAIVNAANAELVLGAGVAGAIRERGGPAIQAECDAHGPVEVGEAVRTTAGDLRARHVIHAAAMRLGGKVSEEALRRVTRRSLEVAVENECRSVAFPAIGTGVGGLGVQRCAEIMLAEVGRFLETPSSLEEVRFVLFGEPTYRVFEMVQDAERIRRQMEKLGR